MKLKSRQKIITDELKLDAFLVASKFNLMIVDYVAKPYELTNNNEILLPYLNLRLQKLEFKDRAILIGALKMHEYFDCEEVSLDYI